MVNDTPNPNNPDSNRLPSEPADNREAQATEMRSFISRFGKAMEAWVKSKGKTPMPIVEDKNGKLHWVNREARKAAHKERRKNERRVSKRVHREQKISVGTDLAEERVSEAAEAWPQRNGES